MAEAMDSCAVHPDRTAIERCEVCSQPLCGLCLWYVEDGRRLCQEHAGEAADQGLQVESPDTYAEAIGTVSPAHTRSVIAGNANPNSKGVYQGNSQDLGAFLAALLGLVTIFSCMGGAYCLPIVGLALGIFAYANAGKAIDPRRTRILAGTGIGVGGCLLLVVLFYAFLFFVFVFSSILASSGP